MDGQQLLVALQVVALALLLVSVVETFRRESWWPNAPSRGRSPRERRWIHGGLILVLVANLAYTARPGDTAAWALAFGLLLLGVAAVVIGFVRGPSPQDLERLRGRSTRG